MGVRKINVELCGATGLKNSEYLGKSDPYVILSIGTTEFRSKVAEDQATAPVWNEKFVIPALDSDTQLLIRILNDNTMAKDDELGRVVIPLAEYRDGHSASAFTLQRNGEPQGELKMNLAFESEGEHEHESKGLIEKIQDLIVGEKDHDNENKEVSAEEEHHNDESVKEKVEEKIEELKEEAEEKKEEIDEKAEEKKEAAEETEEKKKKEKKHKKEHKHKKSDDEGSSSSSDSESEKEDE